MRRAIRGTDRKGNLLLIAVPRFGGCLGVYPCHNGWEAQGREGGTATGKRISLGVFSDLKDALARRVKWEQEVKWDNRNNPDTGLSKESPAVMMLRLITQRDKTMAKIIQFGR